MEGAGGIAADGASGEGIMLHEENRTRYVLLSVVSLIKCLDKTERSRTTKYST